MTLAARKPFGGVEESGEPTRGFGASETVARFEIAWLGCLDPTGKPLGELPPFARDPEVIVPIYETMVFTRTFDAKAIALQRTGRLGTYPSSLGQEAVAVAAASAMREEDVLLTTYREHGAFHWRGVTPLEHFTYWGGDERGADWSGPRRDFPPAIPIATHATHAVGVATAMKLRDEKRVAVCMLGDGATSKGDFYEAVNLAGVWNLPVVFLVANNGWAISVPREAQTAARTLAQKAIGGGIAGEQVDGNDAVAVRYVMDEALARAREGRGASVVEAMTYRMSDHTTADDASRYRTAETVSEHWKTDPVARLRTFLGNEGLWTKEDEEDLVERCKATIDEAADAYLTQDQRKAETMFDHLYEKLPASLEEQRDIVAQSEDDND